MKKESQLHSRINRIIYCTIIYTFISLALIAQKKALDTSVLHAWPELDQGQISDDGRFATFIKYAAETPYIELCSTTGAAKIVIANAKNSSFVNKSKKLIYQLPDNTAGILDTKTFQETRINNVREYKITSSGNFIAFLSADTLPTLRLLNWTTLKEQLFTDVEDYVFSTDEKVLLIKKKNISGGKILHAIVWINTSNNSIHEVWKGDNIENIVFNNHCNGFIFMVGEERGGKNKSIWFYSGNSGQANEIMTFTSQNGDRLEIPGSVKCFDKDDSGFYFDTFLEYAKPAPVPGLVKLDIWSYSDGKLQSQQLQEIATGTDKKPDHVYHFSFRTNKKTLISRKDEVIVQYPEYVDGYAVVCQYGTGDVNNEWNWNQKAGKSIYLVAPDGSRKLITKKLYGRLEYYYRISPSGNYLIYFDANSRNWISYDAFTEKTINLTEGIAATWTTLYREDEPDYFTRPCGSLFFKGSDKVIIYDQYDIYIVDLSGRKKPKNSTNGYGRKNRISFNIALAMQSLEATAGIDPQKIILNAFDHRNKNNGYYSADLSMSKDPVPLTMGPYVFDGPQESAHLQFRHPEKARNAKMYIVGRESAFESRAYYSTTDFKTFSLLSKLNKEKDFNWMRTELHSWRSVWGDTIQGILYKPENSDPSKKYPVIFHYYEKASETLNAFHRPDFSIANIDIPYYDGVPARDKTIGSGLELDTAGRHPVQGLLRSK